MMTWRSRRKDLNKSHIRNILIRTTNWVGDAVMTLPALEAVKDNFPDSSITILARPWVVPLFEDHPCVNSVFVFHKREGAFNAWGEFLRVGKEIRKRHFDMAILFQNAFEAALLALLGKCPIRAGYNTDGRGILLTHSIPRKSEVMKLHQVEYYLELLRGMGLRATSRQPEIHLAGKHEKDAETLLGAKGIGPGTVLVGLGPGAMYGSAKRWPPERFARVADWAAEQWGAQVVTLGSGNEKEICRELCSLARHKIHNFCGNTTLREAIGIISYCALFLTNDSGLMHIAAALGVPTLAIFGSTDHVATGPMGARTAIVRHDIECAPCLRTECPTDHRCMLSIEPEEVWEAMQRMKEQSA